MKHLLIIIIIIAIIIVWSCEKKGPKIVNEPTNKIVVGIQGFGNINKTLLDTIKSTFEEFYGYKVILFEGKPIPKSAFINIKSPRYRADSILKILKREKPTSADFVIGFLDKDISVTKRDSQGKILKPEFKYADWGVLGLGYRPGPVCVISTHRMKTANRHKFIERLKKIAVHELGHNLGLKHCNSNTKCVMRDAAETVKTIDFVDLKLCEKCQSSIN